jgi:nucleotide-binding universal stress UspA family protein
MTWASILAVTDGAAGSDAAMAAAIDLGQRFGARVTFLHVANDSRDLLPYVGEGMSATALEQVMASVEANNARRREAVEGSFKRLCGDLPKVLPEESVPAGSFAVSLIVVTGRQPEVIERLGRLNDVIVMPHPALTENEESASIDAALFGTGRPVIVVPGETSVRVSELVTGSSTVGARSTRLTAPSTNPGAQPGARTNSGTRITASSSESP